MVARSIIRRQRFAVESAVSVDGTGTIGNFKDIRATTTELPGEVQEFVADGRVRAKRVLGPPQQLGFQRGAFNIGGQLVSTGVELNAAASPSQDELSTLLGAILGGYTAAAGSLVASGSSTTGVTVTASQGSRFPEGTIVGVETAVGSGIFEATSIDTRSTDALTFSHALSFTPAVGAKVINAQLLYETDQPTSTVQWLIESEDRNAIFLFRGCQGNLGITWPLGGELAWTSQMQFAGWLHDDELATPQGGSAMSVWTPPGSPPVIARSGSIVFTPTAGTTRTTPQIASLTFDPAITWQAVESFNALVGGRAGYERVVGQPMATIQIPRSEAAETYKDAMAAGTTYRLFAQAGNAAGRIVVLHCPTVQIVGIAPASVNGLDYVTLSLMCLPDATLTDQSTDLLRAPYRIARM